MISDSNVARRHSLKKLLGFHFIKFVDNIVVGDTSVSLGTVTKS